MCFRSGSRSNLVSLGSPGLKDCESSAGCFLLSGSGVVDNQSASSFNRSHSLLLFLGVASFAKCLRPWVVLALVASCAGGKCSQRRSSCRQATPFVEQQRLPRRVFVGDRPGASASSWASGHSRRELPHRCFRSSTQHAHCHRAWNLFIGRLLSKTSDFEKQLSSQKQLFGCLNICICKRYRRASHYVKILQH